MPRDRKRNIFVVGLDDWHVAQLETIRDADRYAFHPLLDYDRVVNPESYPIRELLRDARAELNAFAGPIDGIIGHWDFPTTTLVPFLRQDQGLRGASPASVLRCEHKYLSRICQQKVARDAVPPFQAVDPFGDDPWDDLRVKPPFWLKPVKAFSSYLGFRIDSKKKFISSISATRQGIGLIAEPFNYLIEQAGMTGEIQGVDGYHCIAEGIIHGHQCTLEGYVQDGRPHVYAVIDSFRGPNRSSFERYEYPSRLPRALQRRMIDITCRFMTEIGYDDACFNIEFFHDRANDRLWILEVNPRISKSHCPLFEMVAGASHHEVAVEVAQGIRPRFPAQDGPFRRAAKFMVRRYADARVTRAPGDDAVAAIEAAVPGTRIQVHVKSGMHLSELPAQDQDSYSYETAVIFVGADRRRELFTKYDRVMEKLDLRYSNEEHLPRHAKNSAT